MKRWIKFALVCWSLFISLAAAAQRSDRPARATLAIVGGYLIDGNEGTPVPNSLILVDGNKIGAVGRVGELQVPAGAKVINAEGMTVMPGLIDSHVHLMIVGHGIYDEYFPKYKNRLREIMPISAKQLLMHGVTSARDLGAPLEDILWMRDAINRGEYVGPRLFVTGPFLQKTLPPAAPPAYDYTVQSFFRWTVSNPDDARAKTRRLIDAGVDMIKLIQIEQMNMDEAKAITGEAHKAGKKVVAHGGNLREIRMCVEAGVDCIEHMGAGLKPEFEEESIRLLADHGIYYCPTLIVGTIYAITSEFPERLDNQELKELLPADIYADVRASIENFTRLNYFANSKRAILTYPRKLQQLYQGGVRLLVGTDSGTPMNFHSESTWQEMDLMVRYGMNPMHVIASATRLPAQFLGKSHELGTIEPGKLADIIVVDGNPLRHMSALRNVVHVIKDGKQYK